MSINFDKNPKVLNNFLDYLRVIKNYSIHTVKAYGSDLWCFFSFLKEYFELSVEVKDFTVFILLGVKEADLIAFLVYLNFNKDNTGSTRQRKISAIRSFYRWLLSSFPSSPLKVNPASVLPFIRKVERLPKYLTIKQAKKICHVFTLENTIYPVRNNMIISLFLNTGLRLSELSNLNISDVHFKENYIRIMGKGNKERKVFMNENIKRQLLNYLKTQNNRYNKMSKNGPLFYNHQHKRLKIWGIEDICKRAFALMGLGDCGYSSHTLRHTFATIMYKQTNGNVLLVKELLGHENITTTQSYASIYSEKVKQAIDSHPLNQFLEVA